MRPCRAGAASCPSRDRAGWPLSPRGWRGGRDCRGGAPSCLSDNEHYVILRDGRRPRPPVRGSWGPSWTKAARPWLRPACGPWAHLRRQPAVEAPLSRGCASQATMRARPCRLRPGDTARTVVLRLCSSPSQSEMMLRICSSRHCRTYDHPGTPWSGRGWQERRAGAEQAQPPQRAHLTRLPRARRCCVYAARLVRARSSCIAAVAAPARHPPRGPVVRSWMGRAPSRRLPNAASPAGAPDAASARTAVLRLWSTPSQSQIILHSKQSPLPRNADPRDAMVLRICRNRRSRATPTPGTPWCCGSAAIAAPALCPPRGRRGPVVDGKSAEPAPLKRSLPRRRP